MTDETHVLYLRMTKDEHTALRALAKKNMRSANSEARLAIRERIERERCKHYNIIMAGDENNPNPRIYNEVDPE